MKLTVHQVIGGGNAMQTFNLRLPREAADAGFANGHNHQALAHLRFNADRKLRTDPAGSMGLPGGDMHFADRPGGLESGYSGRRY